MLDSSDYRFIDGSASDLEVVNEVFGRSELNSLQKRAEGHVFEAGIITAHLRREDKLCDRTHETPLLENYTLVMDGRPADANAPNPGRAYATEVVRGVEMARRAEGHSSARGISVGRLAFTQAVQVIELISSALIGDSEEA